MKPEWAWLRRLLVALAAFCCTVPSCVSLTAAAGQPATRPAVASAGTTYYISATAGDDTNAGTSPAAPWRTLTKASSVGLQPGDALLLARGDTWTGQALTPNGSGTPADPIHIGAYGSGTRPHIAPGNSVKTYAIELVDNGGYKITDLELSDSTYGGIRSLADGTYGHKYLWIQNVFFHDITAKHTQFYMLPCSTRPTPPCYAGCARHPCP